MALGLIGVFVASVAGASWCLRTRRGLWITLLAILGVLVSYGVMLTGRPMAQGWAVLMFSLLDVAVALLGIQGVLRLLSLYDEPEQPQSGWERWWRDPGPYGDDPGPAAPTGGATFRIEPELEQSWAGFDDLRDAWERLAPERRGADAPLPDHDRDSEPRP